VLVPPNAGVGSAVGFLVAPISYELVKSRHMRLDNFDFAGASALLAEMSRDARALVEPGARGAPVTERRLAYMRYVGQGHEITVPLPVRDLTAAMPRRYARPSSANIRCCSAARSRAPHRGAELVGADLDQGRAPGRDRTARPSSARPRRTAAANSSTGARAARSMCRPIGARGWKPARACPGRRSSPRTRRRPSSPPVSTRASTAPGVSCWSGG
jgi:N-methylhydantoinase A/oxoprolinase/acetone carboxylase beta subunit